jgi:hypothetical protein
MTLAEAIASVEAKFIVHHEVGLAVPFRDSNDKEVGHGARDMSRAPCGEPYVTVVSAGVKKLGNPIPVFFTEKDRAASWWFYAVLDYAETVAPEADWPKLHLYWREEPIYETEDYVAVHQAAMVSSQIWGGTMNATLGTVYSRLLISKMAPDGTEI